MTARRAPLPRPKKKQAYHHQDLRRALLDAALVYLRDGDVTSLNLQILARTVGVSRGAPYHHFPDKIALLAALAEEGFTLWLAQAERVVAEAASPEETLGALARAWLDFARRYPEHYRVMFLREVEDRARFASLHETSGRGLTLLVDVLHRCDPRAPLAELLARAVSAWSTVHGFASLRDARVLGNIPGLPPLADLEAATVERIVSAGTARRGSAR